VVIPLEHPTLEPALADDAPALAAIFLRCWRASYRGVVADEIIDALELPRLERWWTQLIADGGVVVARAGGETVGMTRFGADDEDTTRGHVFSLYVDPGAEGAGVGRALLARAAEELAAAGFRSATLWVFAANERALRFYRANGWEPTGETRTEEEWQAPELQLAVALPQRR
jgi:ribosomal protein S18 acetylase RimI-like enzyme